MPFLLNEATLLLSSADSSVSLFSIIVSKNLCVSAAVGIELMFLKLKASQFMSCEAKAEDDT